MTQQNSLERDALKSIIDVLHDLDDEARRKILRTAETFYDVAAPLSATPRHTELPTSQSTSREPSFSSREIVTPKELLLQKQPATDPERIACLAYYITHYRDTPHFKTIDLSTLNTEAAQSKFSNAAQAVNNATFRGYLAPAGKGNKQLSAAGELFVTALPDRDAARTAMAAAIRRRRKKKSSTTRVSTDNS